MQKKLTISIDSKVYDGLHSVIGRGNISQFIERIARPYIFHQDLAASYREAAADSTHEAEAEEWIEGLIGDSYEER